MHVYYCQDAHISSKFKCLKMWLMDINNCFNFLTSNKQYIGAVSNFFYCLLSGVSNSEYDLYIFRVRSYVTCSFMDNIVLILFFYFEPFIWILLMNACTIDWLRHGYCSHFSGFLCLLKISQLRINNLEHLWNHIRIK